MELSTDSLGTFKWWTAIVVDIGVNEHMTLDKQRRLVDIQDISWDIAGSVLGAEDVNVTKTSLRCRGEDDWNTGWSSVWWTSVACVDADIGRSEKLWRRFLRIQRSSSQASSNVKNNQSEAITTPDQLHHGSIVKSPSLSAGGNRKANRFTSTHVPPSPYKPRLYHASPHRNSPPRPPTHRNGDERALPHDPSFARLALRRPLQGLEFWPHHHPRDGPGLDRLPLHRHHHLLKTLKRRGANHLHACPNPRRHGKAARRPPRSASQARRLPQERVRAAAFRGRSLARTTTISASIPSTTSLPIPTRIPSARYRSWKIALSISSV
jgi:hypothetical protein